MQFEQSASHSSRIQEHRSEVIFRSLDHLLAMAQRYRGEGSLRQAMEIYWLLSEDYAETEQGQGAQDRLLELAHVYERDGYRHQARAVYERLCPATACRNGERNSSLRPALLENRPMQGADGEESLL